MSVSRACSACSAAKTKCDLVRPACGRCRRRGLVCSGFPLDAGFIFRDENTAAQRNSERARRERRGVSGAVETLSFPTLPLQRSQIATQDQQQQEHSSQAITNRGSRPRYRWLNDGALTGIPRLSEGDLENQAVEQFFIHWTLYPCNSGVAPGHMHELHALYSKAPTESVLWFAVRAIAFADMRDSSVGRDIPFYVKARQSYGEALNHIREIAHDEQKLAGDQVLAAIILIDNFESMYLAHGDIFGSHIGAIKHILHTQGNDQLYHSSSFGLWHVAHTRVQARQLMLREKPDDDQIAWVSQLNIDIPDLHISADILRMNILSAATRKLIESRENSSATSQEQIQQARELASAMQDLIASIDSWTSAISLIWKPKIAEPRDIAQPQEENDPPKFLIPTFPCPHMLSYHDIWFAYTWNFYAASQIVLRESLVEVIRYRSVTLQMQAPDIEDTQKIHNEQLVVDRLSATIIRSIPWLLGFTRQAHEPYTLPQGKMVGRLFSLFSLWVVKTAQFTPIQHKQTASDVIQWINRCHGLE